jgi:hypothetical protein
MVFARGMSRPFSMIVVATSTSARPSTNASIAFSSSVSGICPWATATRASGTRRCTSEATE